MRPGAQLGYDSERLVERVGAWSACDEEMKKKSARKPATIAEYLAALRPEKRAALQSLRKNIKRVVPEAEECISYGIPAVRNGGRVLVWFSAAANHCSFFPGAAAVARHASALRDYSISKGTVRFSPDKPLPLALVRKLVRARIADMSG